MNHKAEIQGQGNRKLFLFFRFKREEFFLNESLKRVWFLLLRNGTCTITEQSKPKRQQRTLIQRQESEKEEDLTYTTLLKEEIGNDFLSFSKLVPICLKNFLY